MAGYKDDRWVPPQPDIQEKRDHSRTYRREFYDEDLELRLRQIDEGDRKPQPPPQPVSAWEWWFMTLLMTACSGFIVTSQFGLGNWVYAVAFWVWVVIGSGVR